MKAILILLSAMIFNQSALAVLQVPQSNIYIIDGSKLSQQKQNSQLFQIDGQAVADDESPDGQLKMYVRNCGMLTVPKNQKGEAPKVGQKIHAIFKEVCLIYDWE